MKYHITIESEEDGRIAEIDTEKLFLVVEDKDGILAANVRGFTETELVGALDIQYSVWKAETLSHYNQFGKSGWADGENPDDEERGKGNDSK